MFRDVEKYFIFKFIGITGTYLIWLVVDWVNNGGRKKILLWLVWEEKTERKESDVAKDKG